MNRRVVITGMGAVTPLGNEVASFWRNIRDGVNGIGPIRAFDTANHRAKLAAETDVDLKSHLPAAELRKMDRFTALGMVAAAEALADSGLDTEAVDLDHCGVLVSSGIGGLSTIEREHEKGMAKGFDRVSPFFIPMVIPNMAAGRIAIASGFRAHCSATVTACAGGSDAIGEAMRMIRHGYVDVMLCGGAEACVTPLAIGGFTSMQALTDATDPDRASIPFDSDRSGFVMGEGAGMLLIEDLEHAKARGARIYAEVRGYGSTCDAYHITAPEPTCQGGAKAMELALKDAKLSADDIDYINAHGTSTPLNDRGEAEAVNRVFHARAVPISSTKSMTGHLLGAAGAIEAIICALAAKEKFLPPNINYRHPDPDCALAVIANEGREGEVRHAMSNSLGFGGHNASLIISAYR